MNERLKKIGNFFKDRWTALGKIVKVGLITGVSLLVVAAVVIGIVNATKDKNVVPYIVLYKNMSSAETAEVAKILNNSGTPSKVNTQGELMVPEADWDRVALSLAAKGYPKSTPSYGSFLDGLSMTMTDWEKKQALIIALEQKLESTLQLMDGVTSASVTLNIATGSNLVWEQNEEKSSASVMINRDNLTLFTNANVSSIKNLVSSATQKMLPADVTVVDAATGKTLLSSEEALIITPGETNTLEASSGVKPHLTLQEQMLQQNRQIAIQKAFAEQAQAAAIAVLAPLYGKENVSASATYELDYDTVLQEITEYLPTDEENYEGIKTDTHIAYSIIDGDLRVNDNGIVGEDENTDIPTYQNDKNEQLITNSDATFYKRDTYWAISQIITQKEKAKGAILSASVGVSVLDTKNPVLTEADRQNFCQLIASATNIPIEKVSFVSRYNPPKVVPPNITIPSNAAKFRVLIWRILPWLAGLAFLVICLIIMLIAFGQRKTKREVRKAELESQAAIQSLQTTLDEHKRSLQDEVEAHQAESNSTANEVRDFVKENPEITAALIRSMLKHEN
ncbi:hypothetical protein FACS1894132_00910 [Clostridia bacterium]|nr:hypothetical protein FACS1894132_00910 [Clostridia bacterium]